MDLLTKNTFYLKGKKVINQETGEVVIDFAKIVKKGDEEKLSKLLLGISRNNKLTKKLENLLKEELINERVNIEEGKFGDWKVTAVNRTLNEKPKLKDLPKEIRQRYKEAKNFIKQTDKAFGGQKQSQYTRWTPPKY